MNDFESSALGVFLRGVSWVLIVVGGLSIWMGGRAISEFAKMDRVLAEMLGLALAAGCIAVGLVLKSFATSDGKVEEPAPPKC
jgi:vacuolar-type H+-ATPase subunit I/STV1